MQDFVWNGWYMAAWADEVTEALLSRKLLGKAMLLTRNEQGEPIIVRDRCPHRYAPLSQGKRVGNRIVCGYHGLEFDLLGHCVRNPFSDRIPAGAIVDRHIAIERDEIIWAWLGDAELADTAQIPDFSQTTAGPSGTSIKGLAPLNANYEYGADNLLDASHVEFLHTGTFGGQGWIYKGQHSIKQDGNRLHSDWSMPCIPAPPEVNYVAGEDIIDLWIDTRWDPPASFYVQIGATLTGRPREDGAFKLDQGHFLTPADVGETHYFWSSNSKQALPGPLAQSLREMLQQAFLIEDKPMIEAAFANAGGDFWDGKPLALGVDSGGTRARRITQALKRAEAKAEIAKESASV